MKATLQLRISQNLTMTPQLQQAIRLLQLSNVELQTEVQEALQSNMMLELADEAETEPAAETGPDAEQTEDHGDAESEGVLAADDIPQELPVDSAWEDIYDGSSYIPQRSPDAEAVNFENLSAQTQTLRDYLQWQLNLTPLSERDKAISMAIIDALDDDGYLALSLEEIAAALPAEVGVELDEIEAILHLVQSMDPAGVGARNLQECLLLQLGQCDPQTPWLSEAKTLVGKHLELLASHDYNQLLRLLRLGREQLQQVLALIQSLNPRPGGQVDESRPEYIIPDVFVRKDRGVWRVELNTEAIPRLRINPHYARMVRRADNSADNTSLKTHLQEARWFIKSLQSRSETLLKVATCIVERQRSFLEHGEVAMQPLVLHDVAEALGMHESTISRVTTRKYMHTPRGIFELKYFFSSHVNTSTGGACSSTAIRALIRKLISEESPHKPLSDSKIARLLAERGIEVARRTVAKYREAMSIPPSNERKRLA
jgi:RNA polymerase sigma-54 factor